MTLGIVYCTGDDAGAIQPAADVGAGDYLQVIGIPQSTTVMKLIGTASGVAT